MDKSQSQRCTSITGGDLNIAGTVSTSVNFSRTKHTVTIIVLFLLAVIYHMIVFWGWVFIMQHKLSVQGVSWEGEVVIS